MRVLEIGSYISVAYAGMLLAEQGHQVEKWHAPHRADPVQGLRRGDELWAWINHGKTLHAHHATEVTELPAGSVDLVIDNVRAASWARWEVDPAEQAERLGVTWVSMRDDFDGRSFDAIAQARAWMDHAPYLPFYLGDTAAGLWLAFKAATAPVGHHVLRQAAVLAKLVEGELVVDVQRGGDTPPWDEPGTYGADRQTGAVVNFRGERITEPVRDAAWRKRHLRHDGGRIIV